MAIFSLLFFVYNRKSLTQILKNFQIVRQNKNNYTNNQNKCIQYTNRSMHLMYVFFNSTCINDGNKIV